MSNYAGTLRYVYRASTGKNIVTLIYLASLVKDINTAASTLKKLQQQDWPGLDFSFDTMLGCQSSDHPSACEYFDILLPAFGMMWSMQSESSFS